MLNTTLDTTKGTLTLSALTTTLHLTQMISSIVAATTLLAGAASVYAANSTAPRACGTYISDEKLVAAEAHFAANKVVVSNNNLRPFATTIDIYWHVISEDDTEDGGNVP